MDAVEIIGIGGVGTALLQRGCPWPRGIARVVLDEERAGSLVADFKKQTQQRYLDKSAERGIAALQGCFEASGLAQSEIDAAPEKAALLITTCRGPESTRSAYLASYLSRGRRSVSATFFSNCGCNIAGAMMARSRNIRGPVLTLIPAHNPGQALAETAGLFFDSKRLEFAFLAHVDNDNGIVLCLRRSGEACGSYAAIGRLIQAFI